MANDDYIEGSVRVQTALILLLVLSVGLFFYLQAVIEQALTHIQLLAGSKPDLAINLAGRLLLWLVLFSGSIAVAISVYLFALVRQVGSSHIYPPPGMPVAFRTRLKTGEDALKMARGCRLMALVLLLQPLAGVFIWYRVTGGAW